MALPVQEKARREHSLMVLHSKRKIQGRVKAELGSLCQGSPSSCSSVPSLGMGVAGQGLELGLQPWVLWLGHWGWGRCVLGPGCCTSSSCFLSATGDKCSSKSLKCLCFGWEVVGTRGTLCAPGAPQSGCRPLPTSGVPPDQGCPSAQHLKPHSHVLSFQETCSSRWQKSTGRSRTSWRRW